MRKALVLIICLISAMSVKSQCNHIFRIADAYGDGWNGASVDLLVNGVVVLNGVEATYNGNNPSSEDISFTASSGDNISLSNWVSGSWDGEISWQILDGNGDVLLSGVHGDELTTTANCPNSCNEVTSINTANITSSSVDVEWAGNSSASSWNFEYDISGFSQGTGSTDNTITNSINLSGLNASTSYDIFLQTVCDGETSDWAGPFSFYIPSDPCGSYTLSLIDSYGDGWNGNTMDLLINGNVALDDVTIDDGGLNNITFQVGEGDAITTVWNGGGSWGEETSYEILDFEGNVVGLGSEADITNAIIVECPSNCLDVTAINTSNFTTSSVDIDWAINNLANSWNIEYGLSGFSQGTGSTDNSTTNSLSLLGLNASTTYDIYFQTVCDSETSDWVGPFSFYIPGVPCGNYTLNLFDSFSDGWQGNTMDLLVNGNIILDDITMSDGGLLAFTFDVAEGDNITTIWNGGGSYGYETSYEILDFEGNIVGSGSETNISNAIVVICPCDPEENPIFTFSQECNTDYTYSVIITISNVGDGSSTLDILNNGSVEISGVGVGSHTITNLSGTNTIKLTNDNICSVSQIFNDICDPCLFTSAPSDEPCDAPSIDLSQPFYGSTDCGYTATPLADQPGNGDPSANCGFSIDNDSWLTFTAADDTVVLDWEVEDALTTENDCDDGVQLSIYEGYCWDQENMVKIACQNYALGEGSFTVPELAIGEEYFIRIDGFGGQLCNYFWTPQGGVAITPPNDTCPNATEIFCGDLDTSNNILATNTDAPTCNGQTPGAGVWYKFVGDGSTVTFSTDNVATNYDTQLFLFSGDCDNLVCIDSDDNSGSGETSQIEFIANNGTDYFIYVSGDGSAIGQFALSVTCVACQAEPGNWD
tara:strand:- start:6834 stop:9467 length:2634 start_codon:yes stop_codon:yes gene_type:complete